MKNINNNLWLVILCSSLIFIDSCKCNKPTEKDCPTCEIQGQICENFICRCPDGEEPIGGYCQKIDRTDPNRKYWQSVLTNGNCLDSVLCLWWIDTNWVNSGGVVVGGNANLNFTYFGNNPSNFYQAWDIYNATIELTTNGYKVSCTVNCQFPCFSAIKTKGFTNKAQDTLWCHFTIVDCYAPTTTNYGEFDQIFIRY